MDSLLPRICAVEAVGIGETRREFRTPNLKFSLKNKFNINSVVSNVDIDRMILNIEEFLL